MGKHLHFKKYLSRHGDFESNSRELENVVAYYRDATKDDELRDPVKDARRLLEGEPIQYICNKSFFYGLEYYVDPHVLIPRPETEELVHWVLSEHKNQEGHILDIGTGSGCILLTLLYKNPSFKGMGIDISADALNVFMVNNQKLNTNAKAKEVDILNDHLTAFNNQFDIIVSNPPYILKSEKPRMGESVVKHEPEEALFVNSNDPLIFYKHIIDIAPHLLKHNGSLYFETSDLYHNELKAFCAASNKQATFRKDLQGNMRMLKVSY